MKSESQSPNRETNDSYAPPVSFRTEIKSVSAAPDRLVPLAEVQLVILRAGLSPTFSKRIGSGRAGGSESYRCAVWAVELQAGSVRLAGGG